MPEISERTLRYAILQTTKEPSGMASGANRGGIEPSRKYAPRCANAAPHNVRSSVATSAEERLGIISDW
jgi:hypothetical protein